VILPLRQQTLSSQEAYLKMMAPCPAVEPHPLGCIIRFEVVPGSSRLAVPSGFNPWRRSLEARLTEEATKGKANHQLTAELARVLSISESDVELLSGHKNARKVLLVKGIELDKAVSILKSILS
jgi:uncharacterized protein (TIGR00251 family)